MTQDEYDKIIKECPENNVIPQDIVFSWKDGKECLRFEESGDVYIRGEKVDSNKEVYEQIMGWLLEMRCPKCKEPQ